MTLTNLFWILVAGLVVYLMMKRGGGCCGGHGEHKEGKSHEGCHDSAPDEHHHEHDQQVSHESDKDPVCGMDVSDGASTSEFEGETYRFCSDGCKESFDKAPGKYVGG
jgi:YHS domain-containing protein